MEAINQLGTCHALKVQYLCSAESLNDNLIEGSIQPLANTLILTEEHHGITDEPYLALWTTNEQGQLFHLNIDGSIGHPIYHLSSQEPAQLVFIPPPLYGQWFSLFNTSLPLALIKQLPKNWLNTGLTINLHHQKLNHPETSKEPSSADHLNWKKQLVTSEIDALIINRNKLLILSFAPNSFTTKDNVYVEVRHQGSEDNPPFLQDIPIYVTPTGFATIIIEDKQSFIFNNALLNFTIYSKAKKLTLYSFTAQASFLFTTPTADICLLNATPPSLFNQLVQHFPYWPQQIAALEKHTHHQRIYHFQSATINGSIPCKTVTQLIPNIADLLKNIKNKNINLQHTIHYFEAESLLSNLFNSDSSTTLDSSQFKATKNIFPTSPQQLFSEKKLHTLVKLPPQIKLNEISAQHMKVLINNATPGIPQRYLHNYTDSENKQRQLHGFGIPTKMNGLTDLLDFTLNYYTELNSRTHQQAIQQFITLARKYQQYGISTSTNGVMCSLRFTFYYQQPQSTSLPITQLQSVARLWQQYPNAEITIHGFTDTIGSCEKNGLLASQRAQVAASILIKHGVPKDTIQLIAGGDLNPISGDAGEEMTASRRLDIFISLPIPLYALTLNEEILAQLQHTLTEELLQRLSFSATAAEFLNILSQLRKGATSVTTTQHSTNHAWFSCEPDAKTQEGKKRLPLYHHIDRILQTQFETSLNQQSNYFALWERSHVNRTLLQVTPWCAQDNLPPQVSVIWLENQLRLRYEVFCSLQQLLIFAAWQAKQENCAQEESIIKLKLTEFIQQFLNKTWYWPTHSPIDYSLAQYWLDDIMLVINHNSQTSNNQTPKAQISYQATPRTQFSLPPGEYWLASNVKLLNPSNVTTFSAAELAGQIPPLPTIEHLPFDRKIFKYTAVYAREAGSAKDKPWQPLGEFLTQQQRETLSPFDQLRVLIVIKDQDTLSQENPQWLEQPITHPLPIKLQAIATHPTHSQLSSPLYEMTYQLNATNLLPEEQRFQGDFGAVFFPRYAVNNEIILGQTPLPFMSSHSTNPQIPSADNQHLSASKQNEKQILEQFQGYSWLTGLTIEIPIATQQTRRLIRVYGEDELLAQHTTPVLGASGLWPMSIESSRLTPCCDATGTIIKQEYQEPVLLSLIKNNRCPAILPADSPISGIARASTLFRVNQQGRFTASPFYAAKFKDSPLFADHDVDTNEELLHDFEWTQAVELAGLVACSELNIPHNPISDWRQLPFNLAITEKVVQPQTTGAIWPVNGSLYYLGTIQINNDQPQFAPSVSEVFAERLNLTPLLSTLASYDNVAVKQLHEVLGEQLWKAAQQHPIHIFGGITSLQYFNPAGKRVFGIRPLASAASAGDYVQQRMTHAEKINIHSDHPTDFYYQIGELCFPQDKVSSYSARCISLRLPAPSSYFSPQMPWTQFPNSAEVNMARQHLLHNIQRCNQRQLQLDAQDLPIIPNAPYPITNLMRWLYYCELDKKLNTHYTRLLLKHWFATDLNQLDLSQVAGAATS
ncbi:OmpA family protein [Zooshikella harenae]|uniref:OmpA family protein n=1 Tax=Zooshikella harenae TaxID=2827238 RepID=A0ABS5Z989_9GAMM|nr:OmpA family protein [Zooshikella harenae]MBU2710614.1 OmpA family protein [Zooshikella harenae]